MPIHGEMPKSICRMPQRKLFGVSAHQVPGGADEGEQQDPDENVDRKRALHDMRQCDDNRDADRKID
jgi:hypothetical protein